MILTVPVKWILSAVFAVMIHEMGHAFAIILAGGKIHSLQVKTYGIIMDVSSLSLDREVICGLAGPIASLSLLFLSRWLPLISVCGLIQGIFNLLPVYPLDGGRVLYAIVYMIAGEEAVNRIDKWMLYVSLILIFGTTVYISVFFGKGIMPPLIGTVCAWKLIQRKIPCKQNGI